MAINLEGGGKDLIDWPLVDEPSFAASLSDGMSEDKHVKKGAPIP